MKEKKLLTIALIFMTAAFQIGAAKGGKPEQALQSYLNNKDKSFEWRVSDSLKTDGVTLFRILFTSQKWQGMTWKHELIVSVPDELTHNQALLFIQGGSNSTDGSPDQLSFTNDLVKAFAVIAKQNRAITAILSQIPNQPWEGESEDGISVITLQRWKDSGDTSWPIWFPMTKAAIRSMDALEGLAKQMRGVKMNGVVVSGGSKRGWTTWLTAASDKRVIGCVPMVIDVLNMPVNIDYQRVTYGKYSEAIADYTRTGFSDYFVSPEGKDLMTMIDPYSYRKHLTMPKLIINATNDPFWTVDALKNYIGELPGVTMVCYVPNVGHGLGNKLEALSATSAFFNTLINKKPLPVYNYSVEKGADKLTVKIKADPNGLKDVILWAADSENKDFRAKAFRNKLLGIKNQSDISVEVKYAPQNYRAFYVALEYENPATGGSYYLCTRMYVCSKTELFDKPHEIVR